VERVSDDPRREPGSEPYSPSEEKSGVRAIPKPVKPAVDNEFSRLIVDCENRRDMMFVEIFESLASIHSDERARRKELREREETLEDERRDMLNRLQQIAGVVHDHSHTMGSVVQALEGIKRCLNKVESTVELVRQQQVTHGKELARVGSEVRGLGDHFEVAMSNTRKTVHTNEERLDQLETQFHRLLEQVSDVSERVDQLFAIVSRAPGAPET
jgi:chromosome segregation ATPase